MCSRHLHTDSREHTILHGQAMATRAERWTAEHIAGGFEGSTQHLERGCLDAGVCFRGEDGSQRRADVRYSTLTDGVVTTEMIVPTGTNRGVPIR
jgi:hypothetical protein